MLLNELIAKLNNCQTKHIIVFDFEDCIIYPPAPLHFYRGYYNELSIDYIKRSELKSQLPITVKLMKHFCKEAIGKSFIGYKGGEYFMTKDTPLWVSQWGDNSGRILKDVIQERRQVKFITEIKQDELY